VCLDKVEFPSAVPFLERLLERDSVFDSVVVLGVEQPLYRVFCGKCGDRSFAVLMDATGETGGDADVERGVAGGGEDVDVTALGAGVICGESDPHPSSPFQGEGRHFLRRWRMW
jgi:hypothetical protein